MKKVKKVENKSDGVMQTILIKKQQSLESKTTYTTVINDFPKLVHYTKTMYEDIPIVFNFYRTLIDLDRNLNKGKAYTSGVEKYIELYNSEKFTDRTDRIKAFVYGAFKEVTDPDILKKFCDIYKSLKLINCEDLLNDPCLIGG